MAPRGPGRIARPDSQSSHRGRTRADERKRSTRRSLVGLVDRLENRVAQGRVESFSTASLTMSSDSVLSCCSVSGIIRHDHITVHSSVQRFDVFLRSSRRYGDVSQQFRTEYRRSVSIPAAKSARGPGISTNARRLAVVTVQFRAIDNPGNILLTDYILTNRRHSARVMSRITKPLLCE